MRELIVNGFKLTVSIIQPNNYIAIGLSEPKSWIGRDLASNLEMKDYSHEDMGFSAPTPKSRIKEGVRHWLSRFDSDLAEKSSQFIDDFFADPDSLKIVDNPQKISDPTPPPSSNLN